MRTRASNKSMPFGPEALSQARLPLPIREGVWPMSSAGLMGTAYVGCQRPAWLLAECCRRKLERKQPVPPMMVGLVTKLEQ